MRRHALGVDGDDAIALQNRRYFSAGQSFKPGSDFVLALRIAPMHRAMSGCCLKRQGVRDAAVVAVAGASGSRELRLRLTNLFVPSATTLTRRRVGANTRPIRRQPLKSGI